MCYHTATAKDVELRGFLGRGFTVKNYSGFYHASGFAHPLLPVATNDQPTTVQQVKWGLIPAWIKDKTAAKDIAIKTLNAKSETLFTTPSFRDSIVKKRCLIFVNGFFEWEHKEKETIPYFIYMNEHQPFAFGGVWAEWIDMETGELHATCSIITTPANELMAKIHNVKKRMPLILNRDKWETWLSNKTNTQTLQATMQPFPDGQLKAHRISKLITSRTEDSNVMEVQGDNNNALHANLYSQIRFI